jgi:hypothetical protein
LETRLHPNEKIIGDGHYQSFLCCLAPTENNALEYNSMRVIKNTFGRLKSFHILKVPFCHALEKHHIVWRVCVEFTNIKIDYEPF